MEHLNGENENPVLSKSEQDMVDAYSLWCDERHKLEAERDMYKNRLQDVCDDKYYINWNLMRERRNYMADMCCNRIILVMCILNSFVVAMNFGLWVDLLLMIAIAIISLVLCIVVSRSNERLIEMGTAELDASYEAECSVLFDVD